MLLAESSPSDCAGVESGLNGDDIIAWQLGASEYSKLSEKQQEYVDKIRSKLEEVQNCSSSLLSLKLVTRILYSRKNIFLIFSSQDQWLVVP